MLSILAAAVVAQGAQPFFVQRELPNPTGGESRLFYRIPDSPLEKPKLSPKRFGESKVPFEFDWLIPGYAWLDETTAPLRFRIFAQEHKPKDSVAHQVATTLLRLYDHNYFDLSIDHPRAFNGGTVDVYLCWGGKAGGEHMYAAEVAGNRQVKVNTVYIYDIASFTDPVEKLREVAHEYGHAALPPVGGFEQPEDWANGYLGEKIYLTWLRDGLAKGWFSGEDTMGATKEQLDKWVAAHVEPLVKKVAIEGPNAPALAEKGPKAMDAYLGLATYMHAILPGRSFMRTMQLAGSTKAPDYLTGIGLAVEESSHRLTIPAFLVGKPIWVPVGKGSVAGASILKNKGGWAQIKPGAGTITIVPR